jgi:hypothetical protein
MVPVSSPGLFIIRNLHSLLGPRHQHPTRMLTLPVPSAVEGPAHRSLGVEGNLSAVLRESKGPPAFCSPGLQTRGPFLSASVSAVGAAPNSPARIL